MTVRQFYDWQTAGGGGDVSLLVETLERREIPWCMIGGLAVNHWAKEPMATADVDVVIAAGRIPEAVKALRAAGFTAKKFQWSVNLKGRSAVSVQISTEETYREFPARSVPADIHGILMRVASLPDTYAWKDSCLAGPGTPRQQTPERPAGHHAASRSASQTPPAAARRSGEKNQRIIFPTLPRLTASAGGRNGRDNSSSLDR